MSSSRNTKNRKGRGHVISSFDKERLTRLLQSREAAAASPNDLSELRDEIETGAEVRPQEIPPDVVTMNSAVRVTDLDTGVSQVYTIVFPADADYEKGRISILSGLGAMLLGCRVSEIVPLTVVGQRRRLRIDGIVYQPEAAGDYHL